MDCGLNLQKQRGLSANLQAAWLWFDIAADWANASHPLVGAVCLAAWASANTAPWTGCMGPRWRVSAGPRRVVHRVNRSAPHVYPVNSRVKPAVKPRPFCRKKPFYFHKFNPQSRSVWKNCFSVLFLFTLDPVFSRISTCSPITVNIHIFNCFNSKIGSIYL